MNDMSPVVQETHSLWVPHTESRRPPVIALTLITAAYIVGLYGFGVKFLEIQEQKMRAYTYVVAAR